MATLADYRTVRVASGNADKLRTTLANQADDGYFVVSTLDDGNEDVTTLLLSNVNPFTTKKDPDSNNAHFVVEDNTADASFILIDLSNTTDYPHAFSGWLDLENFILYSDAADNSDIEIQLGFLENVDGTDGQFIEILRVTSEKNAGVEREINASFGLVGGQLRSDDWISSNQPNLAEFSNTNTLTDTTGSSVNPGDGDLALRIVRANTDPVTISIALTYKSN